METNDRDGVIKRTNETLAQHTGQYRRCTQDIYVLKMIGLLKSKRKCDYVNSQFASISFQITTILSNE